MVFLGTQYPEFVNGHSGEQTVGIYLLLYGSLVLGAVMFVFGAVGFVTHASSTIVLDGLSMITVGVWNIIHDIVAEETLKAHGYNGLGADNISTGIWGLLGICQIVWGGRQLSRFWRMASWTPAPLTRPVGNATGCLSTGDCPYGPILMNPINPHIKRAAEALLPAWLFVTIQSIRSRNHQKQLHREWGVEQATNEMINEYGLRVLHGPFRGMRYPKSSLASRDGIPILFATYELELHPVIEEVASKRYDRIIDVGCAEGYYAVGLAIRTNTPVYAFDCEPRERSYLRQMARLNQVANRIHTKSWCNARILERLTRGRCCLVISDCEGYELNLFQGRALSALKNCDLVIELHETAPGRDVKRILLERFKRSHIANIVTFDQLNTGSVVPEKWRKFAREFRPPGQQWLYLVPT